MTQCLMKGEKVGHTKEFIGCFQLSENVLAYEPLLAYLNFEKYLTPLAISNYAIGAISFENNHPICYAFRTLNSAEINNSIIEKELLALVWGSK